MANEFDRFAEKTTPYLRTLSTESPAIRSMYYVDPSREQGFLPLDADVMLEKRLTVTKGLVCKYPGRALLLLSYTCAANCRYCERQDRVGVGLDAEGRLSESEILDAVRYLGSRPDITEVIFSGGDPLTHMSGLEIAARELAKLSHIRMLRIHTRFPMQLPAAVKLDVLARIAGLIPAFYFSLHIDHPDEITPAVEQVIGELRRMGFLLLSQSVFLRDVNDDTAVLERMFSHLAALGVRPYYIYHCMPIPTTQHFVMPIQDEIRIMSELRRRLSGHALPVHILELPGTTGKVAVPSEYWTADYTAVRDFHGDTFALDAHGKVLHRRDR